jgi:hypothetical protein
VGQVPVIVFIGPGIAIGLMIVMLIYRRWMMSWSDRRYSGYRVGELARRMRLQVAVGDPNANFITGSKHFGARKRKVGGTWRQVWGDTAEETRIWLHGTPYGRFTEFVYFYRTEHSERLAYSSVDWYFECRLSLHVGTSLPPFEILMRGTPPGVKVKPKWGMPRQSFGDRELDRRFTLTCQDPRLGPVLAPVIRQLAGGHEFLHIQASEQVIQAVVPQEAVVYLVMAIERTQLLLEHTANALVGPVSRVFPRGQVATGH